MGFAEHIVVNVVSRSHLKATGTKLNIDIAVLNNRDYAIYERHNHLLAAQPLVLGVLGVDAHTGIAHDGLGASGGNNRIAATLSVAMHDFALLACLTAEVIVGNIILEVVEFALLLAVDYFLVAESSLGFGIPVHHAKTAVDKTLVIKVNEHSQHALATHFVHSEGCAAPIA